MSLKSIARPNGQGAHYQFFEMASGRKVKAQIGFGRPGAVKAPDGETDVQSGQFALSVSVSPVDEQGQALRAEDGLPIVDSIGRTFTAADAAAEDFDLEKEAAALIVARAASVDRIVAAAEKAKALRDGWSGAPVKLPFEKLKREE
ncbi:MAG TPA: hypothetical protein VF605_11675 [Allosphingosinicella sp.]